MLANGRLFATQQRRGIRGEGSFITHLLRLRNPRFNLPCSLRRSVYWSVLLQSVSRKKSDEFEELADMANADFDDCIARDINRTHPARQELPSAIFLILRAIANKHPGMGYCQGVNFVAAHLWFIFRDLATTFYVIDALLGDYRFRMIDMYLPTLPRLQVMCYQLDRLVEVLLPSLNRAMITYKAGAKFYATQWFMTIFSYDLGPCDAVTPQGKLLLEIWDRFVCEGWSVVMRAALAFLKIAERDLISVFGEDEFLTSLRSLCGRVGSEEPERVIDLIDFHFDMIQESVLDQLALDVTCKRVSEILLGTDGELKIRQEYPEVEHARYKIGQDGRTGSSVMGSLWMRFPWSKSNNEAVSTASKAGDDSSTGSFSDYVIT
ncbi:hypothetical protein FOL47_010349 [Perkinsus chesapeaki]|uniref:Rab-GAP TBC domain-containing protein n=1 Tax=Perkinsus chesapeaki TaxID=330153 RepID=A0A7J6L402_PERCH|nr:hypothetical protein FOL47_010349 [Perkinsus chesapeaki]